jgi:hypothetical protein
VSQRRLQLSMPIAARLGRTPYKLQIFLSPFQFVARGLETVRGEG